MPFLLSDNPLDYNEIMDLPVWLIYSYVLRKLYQVKMHSKLQENLLKEKNGDATEKISLRQLANELGAPIKVVDSLDEVS